MILTALVGVQQVSFSPHQPIHPPWCTILTALVRVQHVSFSPRQPIHPPRCAILTALVGAQWVSFYFHQPIHPPWCVILTALVGVQLVSFFCQFVVLFSYSWRDSDITPITVGEIFLISYVIRDAILTAFVVQLVSF